MLKVLGRCAGYSAERYVNDSDTRTNANFFKTKHHYSKVVKRKSEEKI
jgi:hypothetical protein